MSADAPPPTGAACLGLKNVPERIGRLSPGMIYGLACDQQAVRLPLAAGALAASLRTGMTCVLVTPGEPAMFLRKARLAGFELSEELRSDKLRVFQLAAEAEKHLFRAGADGFLRELECNLVTSEVLIVLEQADAAFMLSDPHASAEAAHAYGRWAAEHDHTVLALFAPSAMAPREYLTLRRVAENFGGFAVARSNCDGGELDVRHWFAVDGASPREVFALRLHHGGVSSAGASTDVKDELPPIDAVICVGGAFPSAVKAHHWEEAASQAEALQAARRSAAATLVLPFRQASDFARLCAAVAVVRAMGRPELRVVVRECGQRLRAVQVLALLRLGASSVIPTDVPDAAAKRMVDHLKGARFARPYETDLRQVADETAHALAGNAGSVALFCEAVEALLTAADGFDFESCLVRISCSGPDAEALLARACKSGRDMLGVAHDEAVSVFLFGCPQAAIAAVMGRMLRGMSECKWSAHFRPESILSELESLRGA